MMDLQRLDIGNALYYVELKSNGHRPLFPERSGFSAFIDLLAGLEKQTNSSVIAHCLLQDTVYLVMQNGDKPLTQSTRYLSEQYTLFAQKQWHHHGSLFNKHHHCLLLEPSRYLLPCIQYLHHKPVAMGLVAEASIYPWSSLQSYNGEAPLPWLHSSALQQFTGLATVRRSTHLNYLNQPPSEPLNLQQGNHSEVWALASDAFVQHLLQRHRENTPRPSIEWLQAQLCDRHHITHADLKLRKGHRRYLEIRAEIAAVALEFYKEFELNDALDTTPDVAAGQVDSNCDAPINTNPPIEEALKTAIESQLDTDITLLTPQILTLKETRPHYLHGLYLELRRQWRHQLGGKSAAEETDNESAERGDTRDHLSHDSAPSEEGVTIADSSPIEENSSIGH